MDDLSPKGVKPANEIPPAVVEEAAFNCEINPFANSKTQVFLVFVTAFLLSPFSPGVMAFLVAIIIYEMFFFFYARFANTKYNHILRLTIIVSSIAGWLCGRLIVWATSKIKIE